MTPERIEEIEFWYRVADKGQLIKYVHDLLAALKESQQQVKDLKEDKRKIFAVHDEQCARSSEYYNELIFVKGKLREEEQEKTKYKAEAERLNEICRQLAGEEMLFQEGQYETEMQSLENRLAEAQQTIATLQSENKRLSSLLPVLMEAMDLFKSEVELKVTIPGNEEARKMIYKWLLENPSPDFQETIGNKEGSDKA